MFDCVGLGLRGGDDDARGLSVDATTMYVGALRLLNSSVGQEYSTDLETSAGGPRGDASLPSNWILNGLL